MIRKLLCLAAVLFHSHQPVGVIPKPQPHIVIVDVNLDQPPAPICVYDVWRLDQ